MLPAFRPALQVFVLWFAERFIVIHAVRFTGSSGPGDIAVGKAHKAQPAVRVRSA